MNLLFFVVSFIYFYNIFLILPNINFPLINLNSKFIFFLFIQSIYFSVLEKYKEKYDRLYPLGLLLIILPGVLINVKLCLMQLIFLMLVNLLGIDEESEFFIILHTALFFIFNLLSLRFLIGLF